MSENTNNCQTEKGPQIRKLVDKIQLCTAEELDQVEHVLKSIEATKSKDGLHYLGEFLGIKRDNVNEFSIDLGAQNANTYGVAQGGALYTLIDVSIGYTILPKLKHNQKVFTLELKVNFIKSGTGESLIAKPDILHWGRNTVVGQCSVYDENDNIVAHGLGTFFVKG